MSDHILGYSTESNRYVLYDGKYADRVLVRKELDKVIDTSSQKIARLTTELLEGKINLAEWQVDMAEEINNIQIISYALANGGFNALTESDYGKIEDYISIQYDYLQHFARQIYTGEQRNNRTMVYRSTLYMQSGRITYEAERRNIEVNAGATEELNVLGGSDHCNDCLSEAAQGWVDVGTLSAIGDRQCGAKCNCSIVYRDGPNDTLGSQYERF